MKQPPNSAQIIIISSSSNLSDPAETMASSRRTLTSQASPPAVSRGFSGVESSTRRKDGIWKPRDPCTRRGHLNRPDRKRFVRRLE